MGNDNFMAKLRRWDNRSARWIMRHFYLLFFEALLVLLFVFFFFNVIKVIDLSQFIPPNNVIASLMHVQATNTLLIVILLLLNSFWMLYMFSSMIRMRTILKDISYQLNKNRNRR